MDQKCFIIWVPGVGDAVVVDPCDGSKNGAGSNPVPAELVAVGVQDAAHFLDLVTREPAIKEQFFMKKFDHVHLEQVSK